MNVSLMKESKCSSQQPHQQGRRQPSLDNAAAVAAAHQHVRRVDSDPAVQPAVAALRASAGRRQASLDLPETEPLCLVSPSASSTGSGQQQLHRKRRRRSEDVATSPAASAVASLGQSVEEEPEAAS